MQCTLVFGLERPRGMSFCARSLLWLLLPSRFLESLACWTPLGSVESLRGRLEYEEGGRALPRVEFSVVQPSSASFPLPLEDESCKSKQTSRERLGMGSRRNQRRRHASECCRRSLPLSRTTRRWKISQRLLQSPQDLALQSQPTRQQQLPLQHQKTHLQPLLQPPGQRTTTPSSPNSPPPSPPTSLRLP